MRTAWNAAWTCACALAAGCGRLGFEGQRSIAHVPPSIEYGTGDLVFATSITISTDDAFPLPLPPGVDYAIVPQSGGPELAVLTANNLTVADGVTVTLVGARPFVIVAGGNVRLLGILDASAARDLPGAGGARGGAGGGAGSPGTAVGSKDAGGGGAGFATVGARGGDSDQPHPGGLAGPSYSSDDQPILLGGSGGGRGQEPATCPVLEGGGGGGAIQISSAGTVFAGDLGGIDVGGGGGNGGSACTTNAGSGGGGGSGGAIFIEAAAININGRLVANGGGGGSGGDDALPGTMGADAVFDMTAAAGGPATLTKGSAGGAGGARGVAPVAGGDLRVNAGGGGGAVGRIFLRAATVDVAAGRVSPDPTIAM